jgi:hypothetical protein
MYQCEVCGGSCVYYSYSGPYKESYRCEKHKPSCLSYTPVQTVGKRNNKYWIYTKGGITLKQKSRIDNEVEDEC